MDLESPDVEREFPGLYASDAGKKSNESDVSDEREERLSKKDLLIGKRKEKKDRGYATLEGESSPDEQPQSKSPSKSKKSKAFKFPSKKEKREKSREKECDKDKKKEKESDKDKKKEKESDKDKKKEKEKLKGKTKEKRKTKNSENITEITGDLPIFGVPLSVAVERSKCHDGVDIPLIVRNCIDHIEETGLTAENVYKISGIKSRVQQVRKMYNSHEVVSLSDYDLPVATSLLKQFLRELPEPVLTTELVSEFEEAGAMQEVTERGAKLQQLLLLLPSCNRQLLGWLLKHFDNIAAHEKYNKMNAQSISVEMSPLLEISERLLSALLCHVSQLYPSLVLHKYIPPLPSTSPVLPDTIEELRQELSKQESLLAQIHREMHLGLTSNDRQEQLWAVPRLITQLKRKLRSLEKNYGQRSLDDTDSSLRLYDQSFNRSKEEDKMKDKDEERRGDDEEGDTQSCSEAWRSEDASCFTPLSDSTSPLPFAQLKSNKVMTAESLEVQDINREATEKAEKKARAIFETEELMNAITQLRQELNIEKAELSRIRSSIQILGGIPNIWYSLSESSDEESSPMQDTEEYLLYKRKAQLKEETTRLQGEKNSLIDLITGESDACIDLRVEIKLLEMNRNQCQ